MTAVLEWAVILAILVPFWSYIVLLVWTIVTGRAFQGSPDFNQSRWPR